MTRKDFLLKLKEFFPDLSAGLVEGYKSILFDASGEEINYKKLYRIFLHEYKYRTAPMPAWFSEKISDLQLSLKEYEGLIDRQILSKEAEVLEVDFENMRKLVKLPNGDCDWFYWNL